MFLHFREPYDSLRNEFDTLLEPHDIDQNGTIFVNDKFVF